MSEFIWTRHSESQEVKKSSKLCRSKYSCHVVCFCHQGHKTTPNDALSSAIPQFLILISLIIFMLSRAAGNMVEPEEQQKIKQKNKKVKQKRIFLLYYW